MDQDTQPATQKAALDRTGELRVWLLGGFRVALGSRTVDAEQWRRRKVAAVVKLLALAGGQLHRDQLLDQLWPELPPEAAANNLHQALHAARRILDPSGVSTTSYFRLQADLAYLSLDQPPRIDVVAFEAAAKLARQESDPAAYRAALDLYAGDLLPEDPYEEWAAGRREALRQDYLGLLLGLARLQETRRELDAAIETLRRAVAFDAVNEEANVGLMRLYALRGQRQQALKQYQTLEERLRAELAAEPDPKSQRLHRAILEGRFPSRDHGADSRPSADPAARPAAPMRSPASRVVDAPKLAPNNLPLQLTRFVGRDREKTEIRQLLEGNRLLTLTGPGGCGKTRLALEIGNEALTDYPDGVWLVELASLADPAQVPAAVADVLGRQETSSRPVVHWLADHLKSRRVLLILDNCEHLIDACAGLAEALLRASPHVRVLATSREPLRVPGEVTWLVPSLALPDPKRALPPEVVARYESIQLFVDRARAVQPSFRLTEANAAAAAHVCYRLDGIPLAIELAAARVRLLSVEQMAVRLDDRFRLLTAGSRTALPRHQTLRAAIDWSYALLSEAERSVFRRLAVFAGTWTLEAAEAICGGTGGTGDPHPDPFPLDGRGDTPPSSPVPPHGRGTGAEGLTLPSPVPHPPSPDVVELVARLVDKSLVHVDEEATEARYYLLDTVRQYALEALGASGELAVIQRRHAGYFLGLAEHTYDALRGPKQLAWLDREERELDNLRAAMSWALDTGDVELELRIAGELDRFWQYRSHLMEGRRWLERGLDARQSVSQTARAKALALNGWLVRFLSGPDVARPMLEESLALYQALDDRRGIADVVDSLGDVAYFVGDQAQALALHEGNLERRRALGDRWGVAITLNSLAWIAQALGDTGRAETLFEESLAILRALQDQRSIAMVLHGLALLSLERGSYARAARLSSEALGLFRALNDKIDIALNLAVIATSAGALGQPDRAARLLGAASALLDAVGAHATTGMQIDLERVRAEARTALGAGAFDRAWQEGRLLEADEAIAEALR